jgi:hypothetical protein
MNHQAEKEKPSLVESRGDERMALHGESVASKRATAARPGAIKVALRQLA